MSIVKDAIAADVATLTRVVDPPVEPFGYGVDLSCVTDLTEALDEVDPNSTIAIAEALIRRLITPRGGLPDDADYGFNLRGHLNRGVTVADLRTLTGQVRSECRKDDRVDDVDVAAVYTLGNAGLRVTISVAPASIDLDSFSFTFSITDTTAVLEVIS
jgi:hypothetical protein